MKFYFNALFLLGALILPLAAQQKGTVPSVQQTIQQKKKDLHLLLTNIQKRIEVLEQKGCSREQTFGPHLDNFNLYYTASLYAFNKNDLKKAEEEAKKAIPELEWIEKNEQLRQECKNLFTKIQQTLFQAKKVEAPLYARTVYQNSIKLCADAIKQYNVGKFPIVLLTLKITYQSGVNAYHIARIRACADHAAVQHYASKDYNLALEYEKEAEKKFHSAQYFDYLQCLEKERLAFVVAFKKVLKEHLSLQMIRIEPGVFTMGKQDGENANNEVEHTAVLLNPFYIGKTEVTQAQWKAVMGNNPSNWKGDNLPVEYVAWYEAMNFCRKLNSFGLAPKGWRFTLPTETQWEFAARGGNQSKGYKYSGSNDIDEVAWYDKNSGKKTHEVGQKRPNELGLYDMSGNVREWCLDWYGKYDESKTVDYTGPSNGSDSVLRGGGWYSDARNCRTADRCNRIDAGWRYNIIGFRLALVPGQ